MSEIKSIRDRLGLTQAQFGERLGVTDATVCRWEGGRHVSTKTILAARQLLAPTQPGDGRGSSTPHNVASTETDFKS